MACLFAALLGTEFSHSLEVTRINTDDIMHFINLPTFIQDGIHSVFSLEGGALSSIITGVSSGSIFASMFMGISSILNSEVIAFVVFVILVLLGTFFFFFFILNPFSVISRRIFLEARRYKKVSSQRFLFLLPIKKVTNVSCVMFTVFFYKFLWSFVFIIGGIIKHYSYYLVPYILAENPALKSKDAITLSRKMMNGYKWKCFLIELSYFGWLVLSLLTFGLTGIFYSNSYKVATFTEFYVQLRSFAKENKLSGSESLNDTYLYEIAPKPLIHEKYSDVVEELKVLAEDPSKPTTFFGKLLNFFGIAIFRREEDELYEKELIRDSKAQVYENVLIGDQYPNRL